MKNCFKLMLIISIFLMNISIVSASEIEKLILNSKLNGTSTVAISVKDVKTGKVVYEHNQKKLLHPASTLKVFTAFPAMEALGTDYNYKTSFYICNDNLYVKLGADPILTSTDLKNAIKTISNLGYKSFKNIYFDQSVTDNVEWGVGWMWDDGTNSLMPKFSAYNLDGNVTNFLVSKDENGIIKITSQNNTPVLNNIKTGNENKLYAIRHDWISPDLVCISGTLSNFATVNVPINNLQRYYQKALFNCLNNSNIKIINKTALFAQVPQNAKKLTEICHNASITYEGIFKNSNNLYAENLAKIAGGVKYSSKANLADQLNVFYDYWNKKGVDTTGLIIADASGVSRNNLLTVDFMTNALNKIYNDYGESKIKSTFAQPGEGTLENRFLNYRGSLYLKTGTLSNISGLTGYVVTEKGKTYSVAILIQNFAYPTRQIKLFENSIIDNIVKM